MIKSRSTAALLRRTASTQTAYFGGRGNGWNGPQGAPRGRAGGRERPGPATARPAVHGTGPNAYILRRNRTAKLAAETAVRGPARPAHAKNPSPQTGPPSTRQKPKPADQAGRLTAETGALGPSQPAHARNPSPQTSPPSTRHKPKPADQPAQHTPEPKPADQAGRLTAETGTADRPGQLVAESGTRGVAGRAAAGAVRTRRYSRASSRTASTAKPMWLIGTRMCGPVATGVARKPCQV